MRFAERYRLHTDRKGMAVITVTGRCTGGDIGAIEGGCTRRYKLETLPQASGVVLKALDGTKPRITLIAPPAFQGRQYKCVKVDGRVNPYAIVQSGGALDGQVVHQFMETYQQVGGIV